MVIFWLLGILGIVWLVRQLGVGRSLPGSDQPTTPPHDPALAILRDRFARGEIDVEEYERRKRSLQETSP